MTARLLLVEDHVPDVKVLQRALRSFRTPFKLFVAPDGEIALRYLHGKELYLEGILPDLILLDLNLPKVTGYEVLEEIKAHEDFRHIPVLVLSGSEAQRDVALCYASGAAAYVVKPGSPDTAERLVEAVERIWFTLGRTPRSA